jgi:hypothetical protein
MDALKDHQTAVPAPDPVRGLAPINQIRRAQQVPINKFQFISPATYPITESSYFQAWLDQTKEPMVLSVPASNGRYYFIIFEDPWTNDLSPVGPCTTGDGPGNFAIVSPRWNGTLPSDVKKVQSSTNEVMLVGRTQLNGPADLPAVATFLDSFSLTPLSAWGTNYAPPAAIPVTSKVTPEALASAIAKYAANMSLDSLYGRMATAMSNNPPNSADKPVLDQIARIGIVPCTPFDWSRINATMKDAIAQGAKDGIIQINTAAANWPGAAVVNGWKVLYDWALAGQTTRFVLAWRQDMGAASFGRMHCTGFHLPMQQASPIRARMITYCILPATVLQRSTHSDL